jgi:Domain of unknown function (DUF4352)
MHYRGTSFTVLCSAILIGGALLACKSKKSTPPPTTLPTADTATTTTTPTTPTFDSTKLFKVGDKAQAPDFSMSIENVKECKVPYYFKPKKGNIKLGVEVQLEGSADKDVPVNPFYAKITDGDGYSYTSTFGGCSPELKSVRISKGEKARGWITFELPDKAKGLKLTYNPFIISTVKQEVKFDLGR